MAGGTVPKLRNIVYMHVGRKMASINVVQNQCKYRHSDQISLSIAEM